MRLYICIILVGIVLLNVFAVLYMLYSLDDNTTTEVTKRYVKPHELCVVVPYRDRREELQEFAPNLARFLNKQHVLHRILVINQTDEYRFNRASLINVGWYEADRLGCDYLVMHDVDLIPLNYDIDYTFPGVGIVRHISAPQYHPKYNYTNFIGGILMLTIVDYNLVNGMSNKYWGWGLEDDEFFLRISESSLNLTRVSGLSTDRKTTFRHIHGPNRKRDYAVVTKDQKAMKRKRDRVSGLANVRYTIAGRQLLELDEALVSVVNVNLFCDMKWTPYCVSSKTVS